MTKSDVVYYRDFPAPQKTIKDTLVIRRADKQDLEKFGGQSHRHRCIAWCGDLNGDIIGIGGFYRLNNSWIGFCELHPEGEKRKIAFVRAARMAMDYMKDSGHKKLFAILDDNFPNAGRWVESLGFRRRSPQIWHWRA